MRIRKFFNYVTVVAFAVALFSTKAAAELTSAKAYYLANEGVMVVREETKILFDPFFDNAYNQYRLVPPQYEKAMMDARVPFDGIDGVFISHYHGDHFSPEDILAYMRAQSGFRLVAPAQAVEALRAISTPDDASLFERVMPVVLAYGDEPISFSFNGVLVEAVRIPHAGWPTGRLDVENISYRVTLDNKVTVLHMGDADPRDVHFAQDPEFWSARTTNMAFPPYWYFLAPGGRDVLQNRLKPDQAVGVHVPVSMPRDPALRPKELRYDDLFITPGETRQIPYKAD